MKLVNSAKILCRVALGISLSAVLAGCYGSTGVGVGLYDGEPDWYGPGYVDEGYGPGYYYGGGYHDRDDYLFGGYGGRHGDHDAGERGRESFGRGGVHAGSGFHGIGGGGGHAMGGGHAGGGGGGHAGGGGGGHR